MGEIEVKEAFAEVSVPLLKDLPLIERLEAEAAYRIADYSTAGTVGAWKVGGSWTPVGGIRFRSGARPLGARAGDLGPPRAGQRRRGVDRRSVPQTAARRPMRRPRSRPRARPIASPRRASPPPSTRRPPRSASSTRAIPT
ncbi:MAG: hypothetical protein WDN24_12315 [Sphingomonas sp.]